MLSSETLVDFSMSHPMCPTRMCSLRNVASKLASGNFCGPQNINHVANLQDLSAKLLYQMQLRREQGNSRMMLRVRISNIPCFRVSDVYGQGADQYCTCSCTVPDLAFRHSESCCSVGRCPCQQARSYTRGTVVASSQ